MQTPKLLWALLAAVLFTSCNHEDGEVAAKDFFFSGTYDGDKFDCVVVNPVVGGGKTVIQGITADGANIIIKFYGDTVGVFNYGDESVRGSAFIGYNSPTVNPGVQTHYATCGPPVVIGYSGGNISVRSFGNSGGIIAGSFSATLYDDRGCKLESKLIRGEFRTKRL